MEEKPESSPVLLVDDEIQVLQLIGSLLQKHGIDPVISIDDSRRVMPLLEREKVALVLLDNNMPFVNGRELLIQIKKEHPEIPVIMLTAVSDLDTAIECMKGGASDYLVKPVETSRLISSIQRAMEVRSLKRTIASLTESLLSTKLMNPGAFRDIVTSSNRMHAIFQYIEAIADSPMPVLITGETGVGKELIARAIHRCSSRKGEFVAVNVAGLDDHMFTDTLFGHRKGAFTSADFQREGLIVQAVGGTLFLDEIGDLAAQSQVKLLRLIQEREYFPLGIDVPRKTDARILCATNRDFHRLLLDGQFRKDIYYRLTTHHIVVPPLRERKEDLPLLLDHFLAQAADQLKKKKPTPPAELLGWLEVHDFPGNVRELQSMIFDAVSRHKAGVLSMDSIKSAIGSPPAPPGESLQESLADDRPVSQFLLDFPTLEKADEFLIEQALKKSGGNQGLAASLLGLSRQALNRRLSRRKKR